MAIKLIVGLANPAQSLRQRDKRRRMVCQPWQRVHAPPCAMSRNSSVTPSRVTLEGEDIRVLVPTTFMNLSGSAVGAIASSFVSTPMKFWSRTMN
ncbi:hypothetical protein ACNKHK_07715 [Shigella flexneri]